MHETKPEALMADTPAATFEVRLASHADVTTLVALMREFYAESGFRLDETWAAAAFNQLIGDPDRGAAWLIEERGQPVGHLVLSLRFAMEFGGLLGYVDDLFVRPEHRRKGAAHAALNVLEAACRQRGCHAIEVEVAPDNLPALAAYRRLGMSPGDDERQHLRVRLTATSQG
jgi:ribosomal protein S18 acetylase RimI-like enzyme